MKHTLKFTEALKAIFILVAIFLFGCGEINTPDTNKYLEKGFYQITVDSCEYIFQRRWFTHKGNCKYCAEREKKNCH
jgi:hypothetical protein